jgi:hypothetical protein
VKSVLGALRVTSEQAVSLAVKPGSQLSPLLERCCLRVSANVSYAQTQTDIELFTGIRVSAKTQQRLVQRQAVEFPIAERPVTEVALDGGMVRVLGGDGEPSLWKQYKAVHLEGDSALCAAWLDENAALSDWLQAQPLTTPLTCLGDGHPGVWNLFAELPDTPERREILDWYHLMENLEKVGGSQQRLNQARTLLWHGKVVQTLTLFAECQSQQAQCFRAYLTRHQHRIPNYEYLQAEQVCSIGSGAVESTIKQIDRRLQISGARWKPEHVPRVLAQRCAYLNNQL